ncbi:hypothetical protein R1flu_006987 [Riccia fluitans]|uniref:Uncharacterized protein n=1 Tax=Riccia fluitans TaxID=41844 RepID=A0ABD1YXJ9_9MARC
MAKVAGRSKKCRDDDGMAYYEIVGWLRRLNFICRRHVLLFCVIGSSWGWKLELETEKVGYDGRRKA